MGKPMYSAAVCMSSARSFGKRARNPYSELPACAPGLPRTESRFSRGPARPLPWLVVSIFCMMTGVGAAQECSVEVTDISAVLAGLNGAVAVQSARRTDGDSGEPVLRHTVDYEDGDMVVVEQQDCRMANLRVTLLSADAVPDEDGLRRFGEVLGATPVWNRHFSRYDPVEIALAVRQIEGFGASGQGASQILRAMDDTLYAADDSSEVTVTFVSSDSHAAQFRSMLTLYVGVGGL